MKRFAANVASATAGIFGSSVLGLAIQVAIARAVGVEAFGLYGFGLAYVALWQVMMDGGAGVLATREVRAADPAVLRALISLKPAMVIAGYLGLVAVAWLAGFEGDVKRVVAVLGVQSAGLATMIFGLSIFRGHEEFGTESIFLMIQRVLFGLLVAVVLLGGGGVLGVSVAGAASYALIAVAVFAWLGHRHDVRARLDADALRTHGRALLRSIGPLLLADGLAQLHMRSGQVILPFTSGLAEAGVYVVARRLVEGLSLLPGTFAMALFPRLVAAWRGQPERLPVRLRMGLRFTGSLAVAGLLGGLLWADELVLMLFGARYAGSGPVLGVLIGALALMTINAVLVLGLIAVGRERAYAVCLALAAVTSITGTLVLAPGLGARGAAWAALSGDAALCAGCLIVLSRMVPGFVPVRQWLALAAAAGLALPAVWAIKQVSVVAAAAGTVVLLAAGFEAASPVGFRDLLFPRAGGALDGTEA